MISMPPNSGDSEGSDAGWRVPEEDIDLFATGLFRARGHAARRMALARAKDLLSVGDEEGHRVWRAVADRVTKFRDTGPI